MSNITLPVPPIRPQIKQKVPRHSWPFSPVLELPGGSLRNHECGHLITTKDFVLAVGLSPQHFLFVERVPGTGDMGSVMEQAVGFLHGRGALIFRIDLRCRTSLFEDSFGQLDWKRCLVYFVRSFLAKDSSHPPFVSPDVWTVAPINVVADAGKEHWREIELVLEGVEAADSDLLVELSTSLTTMAKWWEFYLARQVVSAERYGQYDSSDRDAVAECDRQFYQLLTRFEPGYEFLPITVARLL
jgi:hypothetical protein